MESGTVGGILVAMPQERTTVVQGVRSWITVPRGVRQERTLDERLLTRFPLLARLLSSAWARLPPRSALRRALLRWIVRRGAEAANRRDFDVLFLAFDPKIEFRFSGGLIPPDMVGWHHGYDGYRRVWQSGTEAWEDLRLDFEEAIDFGDRILLCGHQSGHGTGSGIFVSQPMFQAYTLRDGLATRQENFTERDQALEALGLSEWRFGRRIQTAARSGYSPPARIFADHGGCGHQSCVGAR